MQINVLKIGEGSHPYRFAGDQSPWILAGIQEAYPQAWLARDASQAVLTFDLIKSCEHLTLDGSIALTIRPECIRCLEVMERHVVLPIKINLAPAAAATPVAGGEGVELSEADVEFAYYHGDLVDVESIIREEILLNAPTLFLCRPECRGLCPQCGSNLNHRSCQCHTEAADPRWAPLQKLKLKS